MGMTRTQKPQSKTKKNASRRTRKRAQERKREGEKERERNALRRTETYYSDPAAGRQLTIAYRVWSAVKASQLTAM
eukprot:6206858-Pleurochrysis_carterae.AAC.9